MPFKNTLENCQYFLSFLLNLTLNNLQILLHSHCEVNYRSFRVKWCGGGLHRTIGGLIMVSIIVSHQVQVCAECALDASSVVFSTMEVVSVCLAAQEITGSSCVVLQFTGPLCLGAGGRSQRGCISTT